MAVIDSYQTLQNAVGDYLARSDLSQFLPNFVQSAENKIYRINIRDMETAFTDTVASGVIALPTRYNALKIMYINASPITKLTRLTLEQLYQRYPVRTTTGTPIYFAEEAGNFVFGPAASNVDIAGTYFRRYEPLRTTDPNWYITNAPEVLLYASLLEAEPFMRDEQGLLDPRIALWRTALIDAQNSIKTSERIAAYSGGSPQAVAL